MDLLFSKYASPFVLLDGFISTGRFVDFIDEFVESENEKTLWDYYMHKVFDDRTFEEFKESCKPKEKPSDDQLETTIVDSKNMLNEFNPERG